MVNIKGMEARRVPNPIPMRMEQIISENTARIKVMVGPNPMGFAIVGQGCSDIPIWFQFEIIFS